LSIPNFAGRSEGDLLARPGDLTNPEDRDGVGGGRRKPAAMEKTESKLNRDTKKWSGENMNLLLRMMNVNNNRSQPQSTW